MDLPKFFTLNNGLRICLLPDNNVDTVTLHLKGLVGSNEEDISTSFNLLGAAHISEHIKVYNRYLPKLSSAGARVLGVTSRADVLFMVKALKEDIDLGLEFLQEVLIANNFSEQSLEKSKKLSILEAQRSLNKIDRIMNQATLTALFDNQRPALPNLGTVDSIRNLTEENIHSFIEKYYVPERFALVISGNIPVKTMEKDIIKLFGYKTQKIKFLDTTTFTQSTHRRTVTVNKKDLLNRHISISYKGPLSNEEEFITSILLTKIFDMRLKQQLQDKSANAYSLGAMYHSTSYWGRFYFQMETQKDLIPGIAKEIPNIIKNPVTKTELDQGKKAIEISLKFNFEKVSARAEYYSNIILHGAKNQTHITDLQKVNKVTLKRLNNRLKDIPNNNPICVVLGNNPSDSETQILLSEL